MIDTPGIRRFSPEDADEAGRSPPGFVEFAAYAAGCRFRDCTHVHEPGCAVRRAVADGAVPRSRYVSYLKLLGGDGDDPRADRRGRGAVRRRRAADGQLRSTPPGGRRDARGGRRAAPAGPLPSWTYFFTTCSMTVRGLAHRLPARSLTCTTMR